MDGTRVDVALSALIGKFTAALPDVQVSDGQPLTLDVPDVLAVGYSPGRPAVDIAQEQQGLRADRTETLDIACVLSTATGENELAALRTHIVDLLRQVSDLLKADRKLGGAVTHAGLGYAGLLDQVNDPDGASVSVEFSVLVTTA